MTSIPAQNLMPFRLRDRRDLLTATKDQHSAYRASKGALRVVA
jgi:hypothetical protein